MGQMLMRQQPKNQQKRKKNYIKIGHLTAFNNLTITHPHCQASSL